jgi:hypothetical protein
VFFNQVGEMQRASQAPRASADNEDIRFELFAFDGHGRHPIRTEEADLTVSGLWKKLWIAAKNRRLFAIRKLYLIDSGWFKRISNRGFAIRKVEASGGEQTYSRAKLFRGPSARLVTIRHNSVVTVA